MSFPTRFHSSWTISVRSVLSAALFLASAVPALAASTGENPSDTAAATAQCDGKSDLTAELSLAGTKGTFTNLSATCSYQIGIAAYRMFDFRQRSQAIFDWVTATIAPGTTLQLNVELPDCGTQVDLFAGPVILSFNKDTYVGRFLTGRWVRLARGFCDPGPCTLTQGYWKNHPESWPIRTMMLGSVEYNAEQLLTILQTSADSKALVALAHQLIAAKLNLALGVNDIATDTAIIEADALIEAAVMSAPGDDFVAVAQTSMVAEELDAFNAGVTGPGHCDALGGSSL
jgi:hypothetical protein